MQVFFSSMASLEHFTHSLGTITPDNACEHCSQNDQWVSHGYVYRQQTMAQRHAVGKRILCSQRHGKDGCGRTRQLYLGNIIPKRRHCIQTLATFVLLLCKGLTVTQAYRDARNDPHRDPRQAWRWLNALTAQLGRIRTSLCKRDSTALTHLHRRSRKLTVLLPTLHTLFHLHPDESSIQTLQQQRFF